MGTLSDKFVGLSKAMAGKYDWKPGPGLRSVSDVFNLIVMENKMPTGVLTGAPQGDAHLKNKRARTRKRLAILPGVSFQLQGHDIRRTASANMTKAGAPRDDVSKVLNHVDRGARATKAYDRYEYDREKRAALDRWARRLNSILETSTRDTRVEVLLSRTERSYRPGT